MASANKEVAIRKRQQIAGANRMMFLWVAGISVVVGFCVVGAIFLFQKLQFNEKVLAEKSNTGTILVHNNNIMEDLKSKIRVLNTNKALMDSRAKPDDQPLQVVLDALPSDANSTALGSSLQEKLIPGDGITIESFATDTVQGVETQSDSSVEDASGTALQDTNQITFRFSVNTDITNPTPLKELLQRLERSIRAIDITSLTIETQGTKIVLSVEGRAFYQPAKTVELKDKPVKP
ncbi:MAG: hypothetical protein ABIQ04_05070 [Candidatus Saccharimonadales bacterium]